LVTGCKQVTSIEALPRVQKHILPYVGIDSFSFAFQNDIWIMCIACHETLHFKVKMFGGKTAQRALTLKTTVLTKRVTYVQVLITSRLRIVFFTKPTYVWQKKVFQSNFAFSDLH
jgi:hypothetical protein